MSNHSLKRMTKVIITLGAALALFATTLLPGTTTPTADAAPTCFGWTATILSNNSVVQGTDGFDVIVGGNRSQTIYGGGGRDIICGGGGNDRIFGNTGRDKIDGGDGNDYIVGGWHDDEIFGGSGNDDLRGSEGSDHIQGNTGADTIYGDAGDDFLMGGLGQDTITAGTGVDKIYDDSQYDDYVFLTQELALSNMVVPSNATHVGSIGASAGLGPHGDIVYGERWVDFIMPEDYWGVDGEWDRGRWA